LLEAVIAAQLELVMDWMRVGFIHGVMNTDNTTISGETIDFGPCAMMSAYDPKAVFSSIDRMGRYAFGNQPAIIAWNMARLAETLVPLLDDDEDRGLERAQQCIAGVPERLDDAWHTMMARKLGLPDGEAEEDRVLTGALLTRMHSEQLDYTITFDRLTRALAPDPEPTLLAALEPRWVESWRARLAARGVEPARAREAMRRQNPVVIPRNHHVEAVIEYTTRTGDPSRAQALLEVLRDPYTVGAATAEYQDPPEDGDRDYVTFCGT
ncbi:MAG: YdiU family protein, partial [Myxococcales bacterium]|nr:YdiU family protein [Myxococcales bacterium]